MKRIAISIGLATLAIPSAAQARTAHCRSFTDQGTHIRVGPLTARNVRCRTAHDLAQQVTYRLATAGFRLSNTIYGWRVIGKQQVSTPQYENPWLRVTLARHHRQVVVMGLHD